jgi:hypothetical protein
MNHRSSRHPSLPVVVLGLLTALALAACSAGAAPSGPVPDATAPTPGASQGGGGGSSGDPGSGDLPGSIHPGPVDPGMGEAELVIPHPGQLNPHPVTAIGLEPNIDGRHVTVKLTWYSGVEPCYVLDSVRVDQAGGEILLTIIEGSSDLNAACIEIAKLKATIVDLGELEPGQYTISSPGGEAKPVVVTIT